MSDKGGEAKQLSYYYDICPDCMGERLGELSRSVTVESTRLPELSLLSLEELYAWILKLEGSLDDAKRRLIEPYLLDLKTKIQRIFNVGLGYFSLDRQTITLSGGELQRVKLAAALDSDLTGVIYIMDEPTIGLHSKDTEGMIAILKVEEALSTFHDHHKIERILKLLSLGLKTYCISYIYAARHFFKNPFWIVGSGIFSCVYRTVTVDLY